MVLEARETYQTIKFKPEFDTCLKCGTPLKFAYSLSRKKVITLKGTIKVIHYGYSCPDCNFLHRSSEADGLSLKHYNFGFDIIAQIGKLRYHENRNREEIYVKMSKDFEVAISERNIQNLYEIYQMLIGLSAKEAFETVKEKLIEAGGMVISIDGIQPEKGHETLYVIRENITGTVLVARNLQNSKSENIEKLLLEIKDLGIKVLGIVSDGQQSLKLAISGVFPGVPHQLCHYHYLRNIAFKLTEKDRKMKTEIKKKLRGMTAVEERLGRRAENEQEVIHGYLQAIRSVLLFKGQAPLNPPGIMIFEYLQEIKVSVEEALLHKEDADLKRLLKIARKCDEYIPEYESLKVAKGWILDISRILDPENYQAFPTDEALERAQDDLQNFIRELKKSKKEHPEHKELITDIDKMTKSYWDGLFACFMSQYIPRTNNDLERFFRALKTNHRRITGRVSWQDFILRIGEYAVFDLEQEVETIRDRIKTVTWEELSETKGIWDHKLEKSRMQARFKRDPKAYLKDLNDRWKKL